MELDDAEPPITSADPDARSPFTKTVIGVCKLVVAVAGVITIVGAAANAMGFRASSPARSIDLVTARVDSSVARIALLEKRVDDLSGQQKLSNFMLCGLARTYNSAFLPDDCLPIFRARGVP